MTDDIEAFFSSYGEFCESDLHMQEYLIGTEHISELVGRFQKILQTIRTFMCYK